MEESGVTKFIIHIHSGLYISSYAAANMYHHTREVNESSCHLPSLQDVVDYFIARLSFLNPRTIDIISLVENDLSS